MNDTTGYLPEPGDTEADIIIALSRENARLRTAIRVALTMLHHPHDGGEYEDGEMPVVDTLREAINDER